MCAAPFELQHACQRCSQQGWVQVEFCFTAEGTEDDGMILSLRGLDAPLYYRAGGVLSCGHAVVRTLVLAALRYWALQYHVDGFCFLNAETLVQGGPPFPHDPSTLQCVIRAAPMPRLQCVILLHCYGMSSSPLSSTS